MREHWNTEKETIDAFLQHCTNAVNDEEVFRSFRCNEYVNLIIENSPQEYLDKIYHYFEATNHWVLKYLSQVCADDKIGCYGHKHVRYQIKDVGCFYLSPTTMRYIYTAVKLKELYGSLDGMNIIEIGGGYGGQCKIIHDIFKPNSYYIYDLPEVQQLQSKFLSKFGVNAVFPNEIKKHKQPTDLVISWCAWSELSAPLSMEYFDKIIMPAEHFFFGLNQDIGANMEILSHHNKHVMQVDLWNNLLGGMVYTKPEIK